MAWCRPGDKPLSESMMVRLLTHICVTRPQWVKPSLCSSFEDGAPVSFVYWCRILKWVAQIYSIGHQVTCFIIFIQYQFLVSDLPQPAGFCRVVVQPIRWSWLSWLRPARWLQRLLVEYLKNTPKWVSEWLNLMAFLGTADSEVHIVHISHVITTYTLEKYTK